MRKKREPKVKRPRGKPGGPTKEERALARMVATESAREMRPRARKFGPPVPKGLNKGLGWGGTRAGAGRPRLTLEGSKMAMVRLPKDLVEALDKLPPGGKAAYIHKALDLLTTLSPPEKFKIESSPQENPNNGTEAQR